MQAANQQHLILRVKEGSHDAFRVLTERYMKQAYNIAYSFVHDHTDAEDIAQEAFVRIYQSIRSFRGEAGFGTWMYRIVMNLALNRSKQRKNMAARHVELDEQTVGHLPANNEQMETDLKGHIERALHELPTLQRAVVILRHMNGLSTKQVSSILNCSEGTVKTHLFRGLKKMRVSMEYLRDELA